MSTDSNTNSSQPAASPNGSTPDHDATSGSTRSQLSSKPGSRMQVGLSTLLLAMACVAVWVSYWRNTREGIALDAKLRQMRNLARELIVTDPNKLTLVQRNQRKYDEQIWDVFVPNDQYELCVATKEPSSIAPNTLPPAKTSAPILRGRHTIELITTRTDDGWDVQVLVDQEKAMVVREPTKWDSGQGSTGGSRIDSLVEHPANETVTLFHRIFTVHGPSDPNGSFTSSRNPEGNGVILWLRPTAK